jgi:oligopeptide/dipeptide ABC transporter ATP-binding protein
MTLLDVSTLNVTFRTSRGIVTAVDGVSFTIAAGEVVGLVGESGSGKSVTSRSLMGLIPQPPGRVTGSIRLNGTELVGQPQKVLRRLRGEQVAMIFQDPMTSLNPVYPIGEQVAEALRCHKGLTHRAANQQVIDLFQQVGLPRARERVRTYPHELSGGMRQRVMIAMAIACNPSLLIADEPTTALDVTIQAQILDLLQALNRERGMGLLLITHDLGVVAQICQRVMVMYAGQIVEQAPVSTLFTAPNQGGSILHPYTLGLLRSTPDLEQRKGRLQPIPGAPPDLSRLPTGCPFHPRCAIAQEILDERSRQRCQSELPHLRECRPGHFSACHFADELAHAPRQETLPSPHPRV